MPTGGSAAQIGGGFCSGGAESELEYAEEYAATDVSAIELVRSANT
ncbi:hypothetical protein MBOL_12530 [Mycobacteroides abscessus subsp. bolletii BD]|nr:hypothetical protein MBOL_12530 [Mycobacteroides abscessus subsp. bolletii BD]SLB02448.1 Uncharacterised protein [Mycobacteroides abscessus subsp. massiliense]SLC70839.1 Uncharacterised protein [Mycobacteroides abscessus subsp. massiliense]